MAESLSYRRETIYAGIPSERTLCVVGDINNNGTSDIVIAGRGNGEELYYLTRVDDGTWQRITMSTTCGRLEAGGYLADINRNGWLDFIAGNDWLGNEISWWENPGKSGAFWQQHLIFRMPAPQSHDQFVADVDGDGRLEVYFWNQEAETLFYAPVPDDPTISPWSEVYPIITGVREEGLTTADIDGDGSLELIAGQAWYRPPQKPGGNWERHVFAKGFISPRVAAADLNQDGKLEIILSEGDASGAKREYYGRLARCWYENDPTKLWNVELLHDRLIDPHSIIIADLNGNGQLDVFIGELGDPHGNDRRAPLQRIFVNSNGKLVECIIDQGIGTHESKLIELDGKPVIVGKPYRFVEDGVPRTPDIDSIFLWHPLSGK